MDSRIICLNSTDAKKLNDEYNSNLFFSNKLKNERLSRSNYKT